MSIAIITGASSGLGSEFARQLLSDKELTEMWLIARRKDRLQKLADDLKKINASVIARPISLDLLSEADLETYIHLLEEEKPSVKWLVCAAGFGKIGYNQDLSRRDLDNMVLLNDKAAMDITHETIPYMQKMSHILEICSTAAFQPFTGLGVYAASKAFLLSYSRSLRWELFPKKIMVTAVCPYWVKDTEFIPVARKAGTQSLGSKEATAAAKADVSRKAIRHFPLASKMKSVVRWALADAHLGLAVSTPGPVCLVHEAAAKFLPNGVMLAIWEGIRRV